MIMEYFSKQPVEPEHCSAGHWGTIENGLLSLFLKTRVTDTNAEIIQVNYKN